MKIALVSLDQIWEDKAANFTAVCDYAQRAKDGGADLLIFPEMTLTGYTMNTDLCEEFDDSDTLRLFSALALRLGISIIFGLAIKQKGSVFNMAIAVDGEGVVAARYAKIHPFSFAGEDRVYSAGEQPAYFDVKGVRFALAICYDLRFAQLFGCMTDHCDGFVVIANWPSSRVRHWNALLGARAIENQRFCIGVNRTGSDANLHIYEKGSVIVGADGSVFEALESFGEMSIYEFKLSLQKEYCAKFPTLQDRRPDLYRKLCYNL